MLGVFCDTIVLTEGKSQIGYGERVKWPMFTEETVVDVKETPQTHFKVAALKTN